jgi:hypothetical protein
MAKARLANKSTGNPRPIKGISLKLSGAVFPAKAPTRVTPAKTPVSRIEK